MMTRKALSHQGESKLQLALAQELKASKDLCAQLNSEREENEKELLDVLKTNDKLKSEFTLIHIKYSDIEEERDRLQLLVDRFDECSVEYEQILKRTTTLERELRDTHLHISDLKLCK